MASKRKRKHPELYIIEYSIKNAVEEYDEDLFNDIDEGNDLERRRIETVIDGLVSDQDDSGVYKDSRGRVVVYSSLGEANAVAEELLAGMREDDIDGWDLDVEEPDVEEEAAADGRASFTVVKTYHMGNPDDEGQEEADEDAMTLVKSTITVTVVVAVMGKPRD